MVIGTLLATVALFLSGYSSAGWVSVGAILIFSVGEMLSSPKFSEFIGNFAPADKKAMYLGFSQIPLAIGWTLEGKFGPMLYGIYASKDNFSRVMLDEKGMSAGDVAAIPNGEAFTELVKYTGETPRALTDLLYSTHSVGTVWYIMGCIGILSAVGIAIYGRWILTLAKKKVS